MNAITRRTTLGFGGASLAALADASVLLSPDEGVMRAIAADLKRYVGFGRKNSGGYGDEAAGDWMAGELRNAGFSVRRLQIDVPWFDAEAATIAVENGDASLTPIGVVVPTADAGVTARAVYVHAAAGPAASLQGAVAVIDLPFGRWSSARSEPIRRLIEQASSLGAAAAIVITNGPTGEAIALNADGRAPVASCPSAILAPREASPVLAAAMRSAPATVRIAGAGGRRKASNIVATLKRGQSRWLVVSTPRSGWTACGGERGPGVAAFLALARSIPTAFPRHNMMFLCNSGHEFENLGATEALRKAAPQPGDTDFWLHLGANLAARDWQEAGASGLLPLPSADAQRYLMVSSEIVATARRIFDGVAGLEQAYPVVSGAEGELRDIARAGYPRIAGIFGAHRFHHVDGDDLRCTDPSLVAPVIARLLTLLREGLPE
jgi:hypothetical protein